MSIEGEYSDASFGFTAGELIAVILGSARTEIDHVVARVGFVSEIAE